MTLAKGARQLVVQEALLEKQTGGISHKENLINHFIYVEVTCSIILKLKFALVHHLQDITMIAYLCSITSLPQYEIITVNCLENASQTCLI